MSDAANNGTAATDGKQEKPKTEDPSQSTSGEPEAKFTQADLDSAREAARQQEKDKLYAQLEDEKAAIEAEKAAKAEIEAKLAQKAEEIEALEAKLADKENASLSEAELVEKRLAELSESNRSLTKQLATVAEQSAARILEFEQRAYRDQAVADAKLELVDLVPKMGEKAEIDAAIARAKEIEETLTKNVEDKVRKELAKGVPTPVAPAADPSVADPTPRLDRAAIRDMNNKEYAAWRTKAIAAARNGGVGRS